MKSSVHLLASVRLSISYAPSSQSQSETVKAQGYCIFKRARGTNNTEFSCFSPPTVKAALGILWERLMEQHRGGAPFCSARQSNKCLRSMIVRDAYEGETGAKKKKKRKKAPLQKSLRNEEERSSKCATAPTLTASRTTQHKPPPPRMQPDSPWC